MFCDERDSNFDEEWDGVEIYNVLDPMDPDSNYDGIADNFEVTDERTAAAFARQLSRTDSPDLVGILAGSRAHALAIMLTKPPCRVLSGMCQRGRRGGSGLVLLVGAWKRGGFQCAVGSGL